MGGGGWGMGDGGWGVRDLMHTSWKNIFSLIVEKTFRGVGGGGWGMGDGGWGMGGEGPNAHILEKHFFTNSRENVSPTEYFLTQTL